MACSFQLVCCNCRKTGRIVLVQQGEVAFAAANPQGGVLTGSGEAAISGVVAQLLEPPRLIKCERASLRRVRGDDRGQQLEGSVLIAQHGLGDGFEVLQLVRGVAVTRIVAAPYQDRQRTVASAGTYQRHRDEHFATQPAEIPYLRRTLFDIAFEKLPCLRDIRWVVLERE